MGLRTVMAGLAVFGQAFAGHTLAARATTTNLTVDVDYAVYQGTYDASTKINVWKGVRYAAPPVGDLRWRAAVKPATNRTVVAADTFPGYCPQVLPPGVAPFFPGDEDCLFLNVWAPENSCSTSKLPVLVWIHGGGYGYGDGTQSMAELMNATGNSFIAVSIQYRLGAFGFLSSQEVGADGQVNAGIQDQAFALEWVQQYISRFGGDPGKVTIAGESAGGGSVMYHAMAKSGGLGTSLFRNGIASSPYLQPQYAYNAPQVTTRFNKFAAAAGCNSTDGVLACLRTKDTMTLQQANYDMTAFTTSGMWYFLPVTDGVYIQALPSVYLASSASINGLNLLVGNNAHEGDLFVPQTIATQADLLAWLALEFPSLPASNIPAIAAQYASRGTFQNQAHEIYAEAAFICPSYWLADAYTSSKKHAYHYQYSVAYASHGTDVTAIFGPNGVNQGKDVVAYFRALWKGLIVNNVPIGALPWTSSTDKNSLYQVNLDQSGGVAYQELTTWGVNVTQYQNPGLKPNITFVNAYTMEGSRGKRCEFWRALGIQIPE